MKGPWQQMGQLILPLHFSGATHSILGGQTTFSYTIGNKQKSGTFNDTIKSKGQGLGLAVVKRLTERLGGNVSFESKVGQGTTFTVRLPEPKE